jgi:hypothetical protein
MAISLSGGRVTGRMAGPGPRRSITGRPWSAGDVTMMIAWVAILPHAAARFEHEILVPPINDLSGGAVFLIASAAALLELSLGALIARMLGAAIRKALLRLVHLWKTQRTDNCDSYRAKIRFRRAAGVAPTSAVRTYSLQV